jgi:hypothetical protein
MRGCGGCDLVDDGPRVVVGRINQPAGTPPVPDWHPDCYERARTGATTTENEEYEHG